jgi:hypothetical protein
MQTPSKKSEPRPKKAYRHDDPEQSKRFLEAAEKAEADAGR